MTILYMLLGLVAGGLSGLIGIGGGIIIVPALVLFFDFTQQQAQGTTLAVLIPPIGLLAAWTYYKSNLVNFEAAGLICLGFILGGFIGSKIAIGLPNSVLEKIFGIVLMLVSLKMLFAK